MKHACLFLAASMGMLAACSGLNESDSEKNDIPEEGELVERVIFEVPAIRFLGEDGETRASLSQKQGGNEDILFGWEAEDTVGIYPNKGAQVYFSMADGVGTNVASFDGGGWALRENSIYSCYYPFVGGMYLDRNAIPISFAGQEFSPAEQNQEGEQDPADEQDQTGEQASLPKFNGTRFYLASEGTSSSSGALRFTFQMLNTVLRIKAIGLPAGTYTKLSLSTDEPLFVQKGSFGLESMEITGKTYSNSLEVSLKDFTLTEASSQDNPALIYLTSAPVDLREKTLTVRIYSSDGNVYLCERHPSLPYEANSWVGVTCSNLRLESESAKIYYTSSDHSIVTPASTEAFDGATIVSNSYDDSQGIMVFDKDITEIGDHAFEGCTTLTGITIPETVTRIGDYAFSGCVNLAADNASANMTRMMYSMMAPFRSGESSFVIPESVTIIGMYAFQGCTGLTSVTIPDDVTSIGEGAFLGCTNLSDITIPDIDASTIHTVFDGAAITSVTIAEGVTSIADGAFMEWEDLISVKLPSTLTRIGAHAFEMCSSLAEIVIPESVTYIGLGAFKNCSDLTRVKLPSSTTTILTDTFAGCGSLSEINIPSGLISIGSYAFECCHNLPNIVLPATVTEIGSSAFSSCDFTTFSIPQGVTSIKSGTFNECIHLSSIIIPEKVTSIESEAFKDCTGLSHITIHSVAPNSGNPTPPENVDASTFENTNNCLIYVPSESLEAYKTAAGWSNYASRICDHVYVDMGNGLKWATTNVGAVGPDDLGQYFAWGRTTPLNAPDLDYNRNDPFIDTAHSLWGGYWRMPTLEEWQELKNTDHYTWTWDPVRKGTTVESKVPGYEGNKIFLPAAGGAVMENQASIFYVGSEGHYWAKSLRSEGSGWTLTIYPEGVSLGDYGCGAGLSVRPIYESNPVGNMENLNDSGIEEEI